MDDETTIKPQQSIRRFDVFAEFARQERIEKGDAPDVAKGEGIWRAKVVASRSRSKSDDEKSESGAKPDLPKTKFKSLSGKEQNDRVFDEEIIDRMGEMFYEQVFAPAIELARKKGEKYMDVRDSIREDWQLPKSRK